MVRFMCVLYCSWYFLVSFFVGDFITLGNEYRKTENLRKIKNATTSRKINNATTSEFCQKFAFVSSCCLVNLTSVRRSAICDKLIFLDSNYKTVKKTAENAITSCTP